jgi:hypothetical protein
MVITTTPLIVVVPSSALLMDLLFNFATDIGVTVSCHSDSLIFIRDYEECGILQSFEPLR